MNCNKGCGLSYDDIMNYFEMAISKAILCGTLQAGLRACDSDVILPQDTRVTTCAELAKKVQEAIDSGDVDIPGIKDFSLSGTRITLIDQTNKTWSIDLSSVLGRTISTVTFEDGGVLAITLTDGTRYQVNIGDYVSQKINNARWVRAAVDAKGVITFTSADGTKLYADISSYVLAETSKVKAVGLALSNQGTLTLTNGAGETIQTDLAAFIKSQVAASAITDGTIDASGNIILTDGSGNKVSFSISDYLKAQLAKQKLTSGVLNGDDALELTLGDGSKVVVDLSDLRKVFVERDSAIIGDGSQSNPLDIDFTRVCWEIFKSIDFTEDGLVIKTNTQCDPITVGIDRFIQQLNSKISVCTNTTQGYITGSGKTGDCLGLNLDKLSAALASKVTVCTDTNQGVLTGNGATGNCLAVDIDKLASLLTSSTNSWQTIINKVNADLKISHDQTLSGDGNSSSPLIVNLSPDSGNMIQRRPNGLYYGVTAPADISTQYVSGATGNDDNPGTRDAPLQTLTKAFEVIRDRAAPGYYNIRLHAGETFTCPARTYLPAGTFTLHFSYYDDPLFGDLLARNGYYPEADDRLKRPTLVLDTYLKDATNNITDWTTVYTDSSSSLKFSGVNLVLKQSAGAITGGGWAWYVNALDFSGCNITVNSDHEGIGSASSILTRSCNMALNGNSQFFIADYTPGWQDMWWVTPGDTNTDPYKEGPDVVGRTANTRKVVTPDNAMALAAHDTPTKTLFGFSTSWDIFANE